MNSFDYWIFFFTILLCCIQVLMNCVVTVVLRCFTLPLLVAQGHPSVTSCVPDSMPVIIQVGEFGFLVIHLQVGV